MVAVENPDKDKNVVRPRSGRTREPGVSVHIENFVNQEYVEKLMRDMAVDGEPVEFYIRRN